MDPKLIIDDDYVNGVAINCIRNSENLDSIYNTYISLLRNIQTRALVKGEVSIALAAFISNAEIYLKGNLDMCFLHLKTLFAKSRNWSWYL